MTSNRGGLGASLGAGLGVFLGATAPLALGATLADDFPAGMMWFYSALRDLLWAEWRWVQGSATSWLAIGMYGLGLALIVSLVVLWIASPASEPASNQHGGSTPEGGTLLELHPDVPPQAEPSEQQRAA